jgi:hypothetical protein
MKNRNFAVRIQILSSILYVHILSSVTKPIFVINTKIIQYLYTIGQNKDVKGVNLSAQEHQHLQNVPQ